MIPMTFAGGPMSARIYAEWELRTSCEINDSRVMRYNNSGIQWRESYSDLSEVKTYPKQFCGCRCLAIKYLQNDR